MLSLNMVSAHEFDQPSASVLWSEIWWFDANENGVWIWLASIPCASMFSVSCSVCWWRIRL